MFNSKIPRINFDGHLFEIERFYKSNVLPSIAQREKETREMYHFCQKLNLSLDEQTTTVESMYQESLDNWEIEPPRILSG